MYRQIPLEALGTAELVPQAIIGRSVKDLSARLHLQFTRGQDDLDEFEAVAVLVNDLRFAMKRYKGYPPDTVTIYLPDDIQGIEQITAVLRRIFDELWIPEQWVVWQRADDPDL